MRKIKIKNQDSHFNQKDMTKTKNSANLSKINENLI